MKIITEKISDLHLDSFWYYGKVIAEIELSMGTKLIVESSGEVGVNIGKASKYLYGDKAIKRANKLNFSDKDLKEISNNDGFKHNNWFRVLEIDENGECISDDLEISGDYNECLECLKNVYRILKRG